MTTDGHPFSLITLDSYSASLFEAFQQHSDAMYIALKTLQHGIRSEIATGPVESVPTPPETAEQSQ
jgi:hypothetical protein